MSPPKKPRRRRQLSQRLAALDVPDMGKLGGCGCPLLVPECCRDGKPGCTDYRTCKHCGALDHSGRKRRGCTGYEAVEACSCPLGPCDHVRALVDQELPLDEWAAELAAELPTAGEKGLAGYSQSCDPSVPTDARPGSPEKEAILTERVRNHESVGRAGDNFDRVEGSEIAGVYARAGSKRGREPDVPDRPPPVPQEGPPPPVSAYLARWKAARLAAQQ